MNHCCFSIIASKLQVREHKNISVIILHHLKETPEHAHRQPIHRVQIFDAMKLQWVAPIAAL
jgi:hypothetical protein